MLLSLFASVGISAIYFIYLVNKYVDHVDLSAARLIGTALSPILFNAKTLGQMVIFLLGHRLQQLLEVLPCRVPPERLEVLHLLHRTAP